MFCVLANHKKKTYCFRILPFYVAALASCWTVIQWRIGNTIGIGKNSKQHEDNQHLKGGYERPATFKTTKSLPENSLLSLQ